MRQLVFQRGLQCRQRALRTHLLQSEHVRPLCVDHRAQRLDLRRELRLRLRTIIVTDVKQVLDVPCHQAKLRRSYSLHCDERRDR